MKKLEPESNLWEVQRELLELSIKAGRRMMHDFRHVIGELPKDNPMKEELYKRCEMYIGIFYPDNGVKNYRTSLHVELDRLRVENERLNGLLAYRSKVVNDLEAELRVFRRLAHEGLPSECVRGFDEVKFCPERWGIGNMCKECSSYIEISGTITIAPPNV